MHHNGVTSAPASHHTADLIVVGSGAAGMTAAIVAACHGLRPLVLEKTALLGGTSAYSGGAAWVPGNHHMRHAGVPDTAGAARAYIEAIAGDALDAPMIDAFLQSAPEAFRFLEERSSCVRFTAPPTADYYPALPGAAVRRTLMPQVFDGGVLGRSLQLLRPNLQQFMLLHSLQADASDVAHLQAALRAPPSFRHAVSLFTRYAVSRLVHGRGTRMVRGNALMGRLYKSALDLDVRFRTGSPVLHLLVEDGKVTGVCCADGEYRARRGVVLATGGWGGDAVQRQARLPFADRHVSMVLETNTGEGIEMAHTLGAAMGEPAASNAILAPMGMGSNGAGDTVKYPFFSFERGKPGMMVVNASGRRFTNDADCYHDVVLAMHATGAVPAYLIADADALRKYGMGLARAWPYSPAPWVRRGYLTQAPTLAELATRLGIDAEGLNETAARMNHFAETGVDEDFGRGGNDYNRHTGDASHGPNPCLGKVEKAPFYAVKLLPGDAGTTRGLRINPHAQVLREDGSAIEGLYACGLDAASIFGGHYPGAGSMHGPNMAFAYRAAMHIAHMTRQIS